MSNTDQLKREALSRRVTGQWEDAQDVLEAQAEARKADERKRYVAAAMESSASLEFQDALTVDDKATRKLVERLRTIDQSPRTDDAYFRAAFRILLEALIVESANWHADYSEMRGEL